MFCVVEAAVSLLCFGFRMCSLVYKKDSKNRFWERGVVWCGVVFNKFSVAHSSSLIFSFPLNERFITT